jgi:hypothetical protein
MGKIKDKMIREEDAVAAAVDRRVARVSAGGGDAMGGMLAILAMIEKEAADQGLTLEQLALKEAEEAEQEVHGALAMADQADKELDRAQAAAASTLPAPSVEEPTNNHFAEAVLAAIAEPQHLVENPAPATAPEPVAESDQEPADPELYFEMPPQQYMRKGIRHTLMFQGVCSNCAHCALKLTDSVSIERGIGPVCSKKGYFEDPTDPDEMQAMIDLAEFPQLVEYLLAKYKPQGVRGLMNGLVKICSLNRRSPVHQACCDAVESLGYKHLASTLRESIAIIEVKEHDPNTYHVWVKKSEWHSGWSYDARAIPGAYYSKQAKGLLVPKSQKQLLWALIIKHYENLCAKVPTPDGKRTVKITKAYQATPVKTA